MRRSQEERRLHYRHLYIQIVFFVTLLQWGVGRKSGDSTIVTYKYKKKILEVSALVYLRIRNKMNFFPKKKMIRS
jgi:hypothetical protein